MSKLMQKLYDGDITNHALTLEMLSFLKDSDFEDRIPANLPASATVYHKIGNAEGGYHDVGIVRDTGVTYYIGVFTTDIMSDEETISKIAEISQVVYKFFTTND